MTQAREGEGERKRKRMTQAREGEEKRETIPVRCGQYKPKLTTYIKRLLIIISKLKLTSLVF